MPELDFQQIEALGRSRLKSARIEAGARRGDAGARQRR
jgi:hypothetical protein